MSTDWELIYLQKRLYVLFVLFRFLPSHFLAHNHIRVARFLFVLTFPFLLLFYCRWFLNTGIESFAVINGPRVRLLGPVLAIEAVTTEDAGTYKCSASNAGGEASAELRLTITSPLQVDIVPNVLSVHMGGTAEFRCVITSNGMSTGLQHITWYKDGRQLPQSARLGDTLIISSVNREDKGMYQCVVRRHESDTFQASAELQLGGKSQTFGYWKIEFFCEIPLCLWYCKISFVLFVFSADAPPVLLYSFIEQTLQPGPAVSLKCSAAGNPSPQISWTLDGWVLPSNGRYSITTLFVSILNNSDWRVCAVGWVCGRAIVLYFICVRFCSNCCQSYFFKSLLRTISKHFYDIKQKKLWRAHRRKEKLVVISVAEQLVPPIIFHIHSTSHSLFGLHSLTIFIVRTPWTQHNTSNGWHNKNVSVCACVLAIEL